MNGFLLNLILALVWAAVTGSFEPRNLVLGFGLGFVVLFMTRRIVGVPRYGYKAFKVINLTGFFIKELIKANLRVAYDVLTPGLQIRPGVIAIPLDARTDAEITLLANLITLTPGTLSLDVSVDRRTLYIHAMYIDDPEAVRQQIKHGFERRVLEVLR
jgi:multicomponent Na+:H+ antiporter subunit E